MKRKKWMALFMALALTATAFAGCGKEDDKTGDGGSTVQDSGSGQGSSTGQEDGSAADGSADGEDAGITFPLAEPVTMSMFAVSATTTGTELPDNVAFQKMAELTNINWKVTSSSAGDIQDQRGTLLNTGAYPDVLYKSGIGSDDIAKYGMEGIFLPLEDLIRQHMPNLTAVLDERNAWNEITSRSEERRVGKECL